MGCTRIARQRDTTCQHVVPVAQATAWKERAVEVVDGAVVGLEVRVGDVIRAPAVGDWIVDGFKHVPGHHCGCGVNIP